MTVDSTRFIAVQCKAVGDGVTVSVFKLKDDESIARKLKGSEIIIHRPKSTDAGKYKCIAENGAGKIEYVFKINVKRKTINCTLKI